LRLTATDFLISIVSLSVPAVRPGRVGTRLFLLVGEAGIGKTRLADELARRAVAGGAQVLWGRCWEGDGAPAYWPWTQVLRAYARETPVEVALAQMGPGAPALAQISPILRAQLGAAGDQPSCASSWSRHRDRVRTGDAPAPSWRGGGP